MNILETLVALAIAAGVITAAVETSYSTASRTALARLETEAIVKAEALLARTGSELDLTPRRVEGAEGDSVRWILDIRRDEFGRGQPDAFHVTADVTVVREGISARQRLVTLKLGWEPRK